MKKFLILGALCLGTLLTTACPKTEDVARDGIATANGAVVALHTKHPECDQAGASSVGVCKLLNDTIKAINTAADADALYCSGAPAPGVQSFAQGGPCVPLKSYSQALTNALLALKQLVADVKGSN